MFIKREIDALRELGHDVRPFSVRRTGPADHLSDADRAEAARTFSLLPPSALALARAHLTVALRAPAAYLHTLALALGDRRPGLRGLAQALVCFGLAVVLAERLRRSGIQHVHVHFTGPQADIAWLAARLVRGSWSLTVHGPAEFFDAFAERLPERLSDARFAVAISDFGRSQMLALAPPERWPHMHVVHCGVDPDEFDADPVDDAGAPDVLELLTVARLMPWKGQPLLVDAVRVLRDRGVDVRLTVVGDGVDRPAIEQQIDRLDLRDRITLLGAVGQDTIRTHYAACDVFCLPSFAEGVPVVLMEAMAMRRPVIATRVAGIGELVEDGVSGLLVRPGRVDALAEAIARLAGDPDLRRRMGEAGRERVVAEFDVRASARRLSDIYASELADGDARSDTA